MFFGRTTTKWPTDWFGSTHQIGNSYLKWSTKTGHRVKALKCHNEVNDDNRNEKETGLYGRLQARSGVAGDRAGIQDIGGGSKSGYWSWPVGGGGAESLRQKARDRA